ncbi:tRNA lysidine(34) synthetase TilS [Bacillus dakarensis]|uniref:tRNA lysidine(34) synthetase TilS n=1 Tax=Robertmurraya dakarensis TaxID=1926278 RepID=UPI000A04EB4F|nr:tRNA lysidine(34) synthetase TilS [Bacillus dakarensis]
MLETKVEAFLRRKNFNLRDKGIVVGVSGGPDSLALLHFLWSRQKNWNLKIVACHVDHMFRGAESEQEAQFVKDFCKNRNIPIEWTQIDVPKFIEQTGLSPESAARECRYSFFHKILKKYRFPLLALGHHGDDQIETILMRLTRGGTGKARAGIPFSRTIQEGELFRPFLCLNREEIETYCFHHHLDPRRDPSNEEEIYSRNRFRKRVLPFLKKENPKVHEHFQRFSEDLESDEIFLQELTADKMNMVMKKRTKDKITIDVEAFLLMPISLQRRGIQLILNYLYKVRPASLSALHIDQVFSLLNSPHPSGTLDFPEDLQVVRTYQECHFQFYSVSEVSSYFLEINEPGEVVLPGGDRIKMEYTHHDIEDNDRFSFAFSIDESQLPIKVRTRENGDRLQIKGMKGSKKVKDLFIDQKVPIHKRNSWPIVTDSFGQIIWIPGLRKASVKTAEKTGKLRKILLTYSCKDLLGGTTKHEK